MPKFRIFYFSCFYTVLSLFFQLCYCSVYNKVLCEILQGDFPALLVF